MTTALILLDTAMNTLMLMLAARLGGRRIRIVRVLAGAGFGALAAWGVRLAALGRMGGVLLWLPVAAAMMRIAQGKGPKGSAPCRAALLLCAAGFVGGMVLCLWGATGSLAMAYALSGLIAVCVGVFAARMGRSAQDAACAGVSLAYCGRRAEFDAMIDSGNTLRDYLTHLPVIVIPQETARHALGLGDEPMRPIFAETAGGRQRMSVFSPQEVMLESHGIRRRVRAVIALSPMMSADVPALVPASLMQEQGNMSRGG